MFGDCCFKCRLYHNEYNNIGEYVKRDVCWRCSCHRDRNKKNKKRLAKNQSKRQNDTERGGREDKIDYYYNYHECNQEGECGNINCRNNKHTLRPKTYKIKKGYQPYVESLMKNQITFQVKLIPCTELFQSFSSRHILTDQVLENLKETYKERKDFNHAIVDLLLMYGEKYVYGFSCSLKDGGQIELHELLENEAEKNKEEIGFYDENSDTEEQSADFYEYRGKNIEEDEKVLERVLERSKSYLGNESRRINDCWPLLLDLDRKEKKINQLNKINIEKEQHLRELRERLKCRGRQMDEDRKKYSQNMQVQIQHNNSAERTVIRLEKQLREYDNTLDSLTERAIDNIRTASSVDNADGLLSKRKSRNFNDNFHREELSHPDVIGFNYNYGEIVGRGEDKKRENSASDFENGESREMYEVLNKDELTQNLSLPSHLKLENVVMHLFEENKKIASHEKKLKELNVERRKVMEYMIECLSEGAEEDIHNFNVVFEAFKQQNNNKLKSLNELEANMDSVEGKLNETMNENKQVHDGKKGVHNLEKKNQALKLNMEKSFLDGMNYSMKNQSLKNDKKLFPYLSTVNIC